MRCSLSLCYLQNVVQLLLVALAISDHSSLALALFVCLLFNRLSYMLSSKINNETFSFCFWTFLNACGYLPILQGFLLNGLIRPNKADSQLPENMTVSFPGISTRPPASNQLQAKLLFSCRLDSLNQILTIAYNFIFKFTY